MATQAGPLQHKEVEELSEEERSVWLKEGSDSLPLKDSPKEDASAASIPDKAAETRGSAKKEKSDEVKADQDRNWRALESERDTLKTAREAAEKELEEWRTGKRKPEEKKADSGPKLLEMPKRPKMADFLNANRELDHEKYESALDKYETDKDAYVSQQTQLRTATAQQEQAIRTWESELKTKYGDRSSGVKVKETVDKLVATQQTSPAFFFTLQASDVFTDLLFVLGTDPKLDELLAEAKDFKTTGKAIRKLVLLEEGVKAEFAKQAKAKANGSEETPTGKDKKLTRADKPPTEAAGGTSTPEDDGSPDSAFRRKDLSSEERGELYRERMNKKEAEERKKRRAKVH